MSEASHCWLGLMLFQDVGHQKGRLVVVGARKIVLGFLELVSQTFQIVKRAKMWFPSPSPRVH